MKLQVINKSNNALPQYETINSAGLDLRASLDRMSYDKGIILKNSSKTNVTEIINSQVNTIEILPGGRCLIPTGLFIALPEGYEAQIRPRSGLALKQGITVLNSPGTIDADYRGEIGVVLINHGSFPVIINNGERIAQMVIAKHEVIEWEPVDSIDSTERGEGGFGHTNTK